MRYLIYNQTKLPAYNITGPIESPLVVNNGSTQTQIIQIQYQQIVFVAQFMLQQQ